MGIYTMKTKKIILLIIAITLPAAISIAQQKIGAADITINGGSIGNILFPHRIHQGVISDCDSCHNLFPQVQGSIDDLKSSGKMKKQQVMNQCRKCHNKMANDGEKTGPTNCGGCHKK